ncbi:restriction endonuclease subunit S [Marinilactibacillus psychrotolerans]|uniref:restriction endonuclease subunit S n=1 Tax=Marinilactibacillus psychrotolerans TaxID=191770 RepID=UPI0038868561
MSLSKENKYPEIRFKGFTEAWEQRKLGEIAQITMGQSPNGKNYTNNQNDYILVQGNADMKNGKVAPRVWTTQVTKTAMPNDIILSVRAPVGDVGKTDYSVVLGRGVAGIKGNEFIYQTLLHLKRVGFWVKYTTGSTFESINSKDLKKALIYIPSENEQFQIGEFLKKIDNTIALHQGKLDSLKELKAGYLQALFPEKDKETPYIPFAKVKGTWEQRKLSEVANIIGGGTPSTNNPDYWNGNIDWYSPAEIGDQIYLNDSIKKITKLGLKKSSAKVLPVGSILFTSRAGIGNTAILAKEAATNQGFQSIVPYKSELNSYFIYSRTNELKRYGEITGAGSTFVEVSGKQMAKMPIRVPSIEEQYKIGNFFKQFDIIISFQQQKLNKLKELKKAYLNKMFV